MASSNKIGSIQRAVNLLGSRSIINLINAQSIKGEMSDETIVTLNRFWDTAQDVAMTCLTLAKRTGIQPADEAYTLGLFHDCGVPLMLKRFPSYMEVLEEAYAKAGGETRWWIPKTAPSIPTIRWSATSPPSPGACRSTSLPPSPPPMPWQCSATTPREHPEPAENLLAVLKMAEHICASYRVLGNQAVDHEWRVVGPLVLDYIGLSDYDFENLKQNIRELGGH